MRVIRSDYESRRKKSIRAIVIVAGLLAVGAAVFFIGSGKKGQPVAAAASAPAVADPGATAEAGAGVDLAGLVKKIRPAVVAIETFDDLGRPVGVGSGFVFNQDGQVLSNDHVFRNARKARVRTEHGTFPVRSVVAKNGDCDLILVQVRFSGPTVAPLKRSVARPEVGERIMVMGNPLGLEATVSDGIVSAIRDVPGVGPVIQVTSPISPGSSGSPVVNMRGEVVGVASFQLLKGQNLNFAVAIEMTRLLKPAQGSELSALNSVDPQVLEGMDDFGRGVACFEAGSYNEAASYLNRVLEKNPLHAEAYFYLGRCYQELRDPDAVEAFKRAIELKPDHVDALCRLGAQYVRMRMYGEALDVLQQAKDLRPDHFDALLPMGVAYYRKGEHGAAVAVLQKAVRLVEDAEAYHWLGASYLKLAESSKGITALSRSVEIDPGYVPGYLELAKAMETVQNWSGGIRVLNQALARQPDNPEAHVLLGIMHLGNDDLAAAEAELAILNKMKKDDFAIELSSKIYSYKSRRRF